MGWITVYVRGRTGAHAEVVKNLDQAGFRYMEGSSTEKGLGLYWINRADDLRAFKKAIGSKTVLKYRLRFYTNVEDFIESRHNPRTIVFET
jgi:hypothetical protein